MSPTGRRVRLDETTQFTLHACSVSSLDHSEPRCCRARDIYKARPRKKRRSAVRTPARCLELALLPRVDIFSSDPSAFRRRLPGRSLSFLYYIHSCRESSTTHSIEQPREGTIEMGRSPCCDKTKVKRGPWSQEEDAILRSFVERFGNAGNWIALPQKAGR